MEKPGRRKDTPELLGTSRCTTEKIINKTQIMA